MKNMKRILCLVLAVLMLATVLVSCKKNTQTDTGETTAAADGTASNPAGAGSADVSEETEKPWETDANGYVLDSIESVDLGGKEIRILTGSNRMAENYVSSEDLTTQIKSAVFSRNQAVQVRLKCKLNYIEEPDGWENQASYTEKAMSLSTTNEVDMFAVYSLTTNTLMVNGVLADLLNNDIIEFDKPYWNGKMVESCTLYDRMYFCTGEISYSLIHALYITMFNKDLANYLGVPKYLQETYGVDSLYELVRSGEWTLDKMITIAKQFYSDTDGLKNEGDTFGYVTSIVFMDAYWAGSDLRHLEKGSDGSIVISDDMSSQKASDLSAMLLDFMKTPAAMVHGSFSTAEGDPAPQKFWKKGAALLYGVTIDQFMTEESFEMGVLPTPKYNSEQEEYLTCPGFGYAMWGIARSAANYEELCYVLECLASESYRKTIPVYFEQMLLGRQDTQDDYEVLQTIRASAVVDGGRVMDKVFGSMTFYCFRGALAGGVEYAGYYAKYEESLKEQAISLNSLVLNMEQLYS